MDDGRGQIERLYRELAPAILGYLRGVVGPSDTAEDLLQETFARALGGRRRLAEAASKRAWLYAIARNLARDHLRRRRKLQELPEQVPGPPTREEDARLQPMREAIARLPPPLREALELRLRHELSYEEIASVLGIPMGTVRSRLHNAVALLREAVAARNG